MERNQIGRGWPYFRNMAIDIQEETKTPIPVVSSRLPDKWTSKPIEYRDEGYHSEIMEMAENPVQGMMPQPLHDTYNEDEILSLKLNYSDMAGRIEPYAAKVIGECEYKGSPIFDECIDKGCIAQIVDRVMEYAEAGVVEVQHIRRGGEHDSHGKCSLLREIAELVVLNELYWRRRPVYRRYFMP